MGQILFLSRKKTNDYGGLAKFYKELRQGFSKKGKISLIHLCDATLLPVGVLLKIILRKPLTLTAHGLDLTWPNPAYQLMLRLTMPFADAIILDSQSARLLLKPFKIPVQKIHKINPGISIDHFKSPIFFSLPDLKGKIVLLTVGNLVNRKGHLWFIKNILAKLSDDFIYLVVGDGPERKNLEFRKRVFLLGRLTDSELGYVFKKAHIYVCPNQHQPGNFEGFGISAGEAASLGLPVVATKVDGLPEIIKDGQNGILVNPKPEDFIKALNKLKDPRLRKRLGQKAIIYTRKNFRWKKTCQEYLKIFQELINKT